MGIKCNFLLIGKKNGGEYVQVYNEQCILKPCTPLSLSSD